MAEPYQKKRARWTAQAAELPYELGDRVALRNIPKVAVLPQHSQKTLADALDARLKRVLTALQLLKSKPDMSVEDLLLAAESEDLSKAKKEKTDTSQINREPGSLEGTSEEAVLHHVKEETYLSTKYEIEAMADQLQVCFPGMERVPAEALAAAPVMKKMMAVFCAQQACVEDDVALRSETLLLIAAQLCIHWHSQLDEIIQSDPAYQLAFSKSNLNWPIFTNS